MLASQERTSGVEESTRSSAWIQQVTIRIFYEIEILFKVLFYAGPLFAVNNPVTRLDFSDADYVESIHTDTVFGIGATISHVDFFPNNGQLQPGCFTPVCDHSRAVLFYAEAINSNLFRGNRCTSLEDIRQSATCSGESVVMGNSSNARNSARGIYQLFTNSQFPFGRG